MARSLAGRKKGQSRLAGLRGQPGSKAMAPGQLLVALGKPESVQSVLGFGLPSGSCLGCQLAMPLAGTTLPRAWLPSGCFNLK